MRSRAEPAPAKPKRPAVMDRYAGMDARMSTSDVVRVVGVNRSTLFRWCKKGIFPSKHISGGWLRSDIERWFATKVEQGA
jgi:predicted DNA-binding transcriptional regulator AlpA